MLVEHKSNEKLKASYISKESGKYMHPSLQNQFKQREKEKKRETTQTKSHVLLIGF